MIVLNLNKKGEGGEQVHLLMSLCANENASDCQVRRGSYQGGVKYCIIRGMIVFVYGEIYKIILLYPLEANDCKVLCV